NNAANPQCKIDVVTTARSTDPSRIDVKYKDGKAVSIDADQLHGAAIVAQVEKYARKLSQQEDIKNQ
ncbi:hypothetical protein H4S02_011595, partial [Coemansia sp. RSA 2611]